MIASLPMYDWPEVRAETDAFWAALSLSLKSAGLEAPNALTRPEDPWPAWRADDLILSQTCGLPYSAQLSEDVLLLGAPAYRIDADPGWYHSEIVVRRDMAAASPHDLANLRFAYNMRESQSGWAALNAMLPIEETFGALVQSGAHRESLAMVTRGEADCAAIDAVSWALALRHEPAAKDLRVIGRTPATPGLPYITSKAHAGRKNEMIAAIATTIRDLDDNVREALLLDGFEPFSAADYALLADGWPQTA